jgi:hypothetical protein
MNKVITLLKNYVKAANGLPQTLERTEKVVATGTHFTELPNDQRSIKTDTAVLSLT